MTYMLLMRATLTGIILDGGNNPDVIPSEAKLEFMLRAPLRSDLDRLEEHAVACFKAAATATGCEVTTDELWSKFEFLFRLEHHFTRIFSKPCSLSLAGSLKSS